MSLSTKQILCSLGVVLGFMPGMVRSSEPVSIDFNVANPPFMYEEGGGARGIYPSIIKAAFQHMKVEVRLQVKPWARVLTDLNKGTAGAGGVYLTEERARIYDYSEPFFTETLRVYFHVASPVDFHGVGDLKGRNIGVARGRSYGDAFDRARARSVFAVSETGSDEQNFMKLDLARVDTAIAIEEQGALQMRRFGNVRVAPVPLARNGVYLAFAKTADRQALLEKFNRTLKAMRASGELERIVSEQLKR